MQHAFKTPTLRNADLRPPFMHDGSEHSLECVIAFYDRGGDEKRPSLATEITPLHLTGAEMNDLAAFLRTLDSSDNPVTVPVLPH
jgi:cytochrome c peroxidase